MPLFGDKERIAVEYELDENYEGTRLYGYFCYWMHGVQVGDYDRIISLGDLLTVFAPIVKDNGNRSGTEMFSMSVDDLSSLLYAGLYGNDDPGLEEMSAEGQWARYDLRPHLDNFDDYEVYMIECDGVARVIVKQVSSGQLQDFRLPAGAFDSPSREAFLAMEALWEAEAAKDSGEI